VAARLLATLGHVVVHTGVADEAERLFREGGDFDVVMMDLLLEDTDGASLAQRLAASVAHEIRVLFISGADLGPPEEQPWLQAPCRRFLAKPFSAEALQTELDLLMAPQSRCA
jgi:CheY-like chemotaxis protein